MADEVVTTPVAPTPVVQAKPGMKGGPGSADALLDAYDSEIEGEAQEIETAADKQVKIQEAAEKKAAAKEVVKKLEQTGEDDQTTEQAPQPEGEASSEEKAEKPVNVLKAEHDGAEIEIPENAEVVFEVNGKPFKFTVADAVKARLGQEKFNRQMDQRLSYVSEREKRVESRIGTILERAQKAIEASKSGDFLPALKAMARLAAGNEVDAVDVERQFLERLQEVDNVYRKMTPEQRAAYFAEQKAKAAEEKAKRLEQQVNYSESIKQTDAEVDQLCEQVGLTKQQFVALYHEFIIPELVGPNKPFKTVEEIGPRDVAAVHLEFSTREKIEHALKEVDPALSQDFELSQLIFEQAIQNPSWQKEDLKYIINQIVRNPSKSVQNLNRKVEKAKTQRLNSSLKQGSANGKESEIDDDLYRDFHRKAEREGWAGRLK